VTSIHRDQRAIDSARTALRELREVAPSLVFASVVTDDGFEVVHVPDNADQTDRFASMTSSVQALGEAVTRELSIGSTGYVVIAAENGHVLQLRVTGHELILAALFDTHETLGKALASSRRCVERLAALLAEHNFQEPLGSSTDY
jgi:predicted regulator of Ras-like GTPase activity (Roadblock/LC7/MglB family)